MNIKDFNNIEKTLKQLQSIYKTKHYVVDSLNKVKEISLKSRGLDISSGGYITAWDIDDGKHWFTVNQLYTKEEAEQIVRERHNKTIKGLISMKQHQLENIGNEISQLKKELKQ